MVLSQAFNGLRPLVSSSAALEVLLVATGYKLSARVRVKRNEMHLVQIQLQSIGLKFAVGFEEVQSCTDLSLSREWASFGDGRYHSSMKSYLYIAAEKDVAERLRNADERCDIMETGRLLGYPACCTQMFQTIARDADIANTPIFFVYENGLQASWLMNVCLLCDDCTLITHVPCAADCLASIQIAQNAFAVLFDIDQQLARTYCSRLSGSILYGQDGSYISFSRFETGKRIDHVQTVSTAHALSPAQLIGQEVQVGQTDVMIGSIKLLSDQFKYYEFK